MISHFFIDRPIFASVLSIVIMVLGLVALQALPIAQFPEITPPVVQIEADYPGANAEILADSVAAYRGAASRDRQPAVLRFH